MIVCPVVGEAGLKEKLVDNGAGLTVTVCVVDAVVPEESVTESCTVNDPLLENE